MTEPASRPLSERLGDARRQGGQETAPGAHFPPRMATPPRLPPEQPRPVQRPAWNEPGDIVMQERSDGGVTVTHAPAESRMGLLIFRSADRDRLAFVEPDLLLLPPDASGISVVYRIEGWDEIHKCLIIRRIPREDPK